MQSAYPDPANVVRIQLFGTPALVDAAGWIYPLPHAVAQLLAYVLLGPTPANRERIAEALWSERAPGYARRRLADTLYRLRRDYNPDWIALTSTTLASGTALPEVDLWRFEALIASEQPADLAQAVALYQADLLVDLDAEWAILRRAEVRERFLDGLWRLGQIAATAEEWASAIDWFQRLVNEDPLREEAYQALMRSLVRGRRTAEALAVYQHLKRVLRSELGVAPTLSSQALADQIRHEHIHTTATRPSAPDAHTHPPLVGRQDERTRLLTLLDQAQTGCGTLALVLGEAGIGKSRLLAELASAAEWRGWQVVRGNADATHTHNPLIDALEQALGGPRAHQLAHLVPTPLLSIASRVLPTLAPLATPGTDQIGVAELSAAISAVLTGLCQIVPHLLLLDDLHWAADDLWALLAQLHTHLTDQRLLVVITGRSEELQAQTAWTQISAWDTAGVPVLPLMGLTEAELAELMRRITQRMPTTAELKQLQAASNGNPLIALTLLQGDPLHPAPPAPLHDLMLRRVDLLAPAHRRAITAAAILGSTLAYAQWEALLALAGLPPAELPTLAGHLEQRSLLIPEAQGYRFSHDTLRSAIYQQIAPAERQIWHQHALDVLQRLAPAQAAAQLYHAEGAHNTAAIARTARAAGEQALQQIAPSSAAHYFSIALAALTTNAVLERYHTLLGRVRANQLCADTAAQERDLDELHILAPHLDDSARLTILRQQIELTWTLGQLEQGEALAQQAIQLAEQHQDVAHAAAFFELLGRIMRHRGAFDQAEQAFRRAQTLYAQTNAPLGTTIITDLLGGVAWSRGDYVQAAALHQAAADQFHTLGATFHEARALNKLGSAYWGMGDFLAARATHQRSLAVCRANGDRLGMSDNLDNLGGVAWVLGDYPTAITFYEQALTLRRAAHNAWGIAISLGNLGSAYRLLGDQTAALEQYAQALIVNQAMGRRPGEAYVHHGRGLSLLALGQLNTAHAALSTAYQIRCALNGRDGRIDTSAALALCHLYNEEREAAQALIREALDLLRTDDRPPLRQWVQYVAFRIATASGDQATAFEHLDQAHQAMHIVGDRLPPTERDHFLRNVPLNRNVQAAFAEYSTTYSVNLVRTGTPLGRKLTAADYVTVTWTLHTPADTQIPTAAERRRSVIRRLLTEAAAQGGTPTDSDLATALGVSRRTILRDMALLTQADHPAPTRRRKR
jgi:DNA-binding SARP family transcriptional activator